MKQRIWVQQVVRTSKRYKSSNDEHGIKDVVLEGEQGQTHVGENEVLCQEIQQLEQLQHKRNDINATLVHAETQVTLTAI